MGGPALSLSSSPGDIRDEVDARHTWAEQAQSLGGGLARGGLSRHGPSPRCWRSCPAVCRDVAGAGHRHAGLPGRPEDHRRGGEGSTGEGKLFFTTVRVQGGPGTQVTAVRPSGAALDDQSRRLSGRTRSSSILDPRERPAGKCRGDGGSRRPQPPWPSAPWAMTCRSVSSLPRSSGLAIGRADRGR